MKLTETDIRSSKNEPVLRKYFYELSNYFDPEDDEFTYNEYYKNVTAEFPRPVNMYMIEDEIKGENRTVGFVLLQDIPAARFMHPDFLYIVDFYIYPEYRKCGYGKQAFNCVLMMTNKPVVLDILHRNDPAKNFWNKCFDDCLSDNKTVNKWYDKWIMRCVIKDVNNDDSFIWDNMIEIK